MSPSRPSGPRTRLDALQQPALARRTRPLLVQLGTASLLGIAGVGCSLMSAHTLLRLSDTSRIWPALGNLAAVLVAVASLLQWHCWRQARKEWTGERDVALMHLLGPSRLARWVGLAGALAGPWACLQVVRQTAPAEQAHWWAVAAALCTILAAGFGAIHRFDPAGPRGVLPARVRPCESGTAPR